MSHKIKTWLLSVLINLLGKKKIVQISREKKPVKPLRKKLISKTEHCIFYYKAYGWKYYLILLTGND